MKRHRVVNVIIDYYIITISLRETEELATVVEFIESKSEVNPKEIALARREEMKKKAKTKNSGKKKGKKGKY